MYAKTNPRAGQLSRRQKRSFAAVGAVVLLAFAGLGTWGALAHDPYAGSGHGCVSVTLPSSTGGATLHDCGAQARSFCLTAVRSSGPLWLRARPQCVLAGLGPRARASAGPS